MPGTGMAINRPEIFQRAMQGRPCNVESCGRLLVLVVAVRRHWLVGPTNAAVRVLVYRTVEHVECLVRIR